MEVVVARAHDRGGEELIGVAAPFQAAADVHGDVGDLVVRQRDAQSLLQPARDEDRDLEDHRVGRLQRPGERIARPRLLLGTVLQVLDVKRQPQDEVVVDDVDEEFCGGRLDDLAHRCFDLGIQPRAGLVGRGLEAGGHDAREHERRQVLQVGQVPARRRGGACANRAMIAATSCCAGRASAAPVSSAAVLRDAVGGDGDVHDDVGDADLVHEVAEAAELG